MPKRSRLLLTGLVWGAFFFRLQSLFYNHFQADEALFASWARQIAVWRDPLLKMQPVDKPPLLFYLQSFFYPLFGPVEWAARIPNFVVSILIIPLVAVLSWQIYKDEIISLLAALFLAFWPLAIQFSSTAFTDPLLTFLIWAAVLFVIFKPSPALSGLMFGLAAATKYQAWLFLPLLLGIALVLPNNQRCLRRWLAGFLPIFVLLLVWEGVRGEQPLLWSAQIGNYGGIRLVWSWEFAGRLLLWLRLWQVSLGTWIWVVLTAGCFVVLVIQATRKLDEQAAIDFVLIIFACGYMVLHWLLAVPVWDRYLLPLLPIVAILLARGLAVAYFWLTQLRPVGDFKTPDIPPRESTSNFAQISEVHLFKNWGNTIKRLTLRSWEKVIALGFIFLILVLSLPGAAAAQGGAWPIGGQRGADQGAWQIGQFLENEPYGTVLYDHWFSWQWRYHLFDKKIYVSWFPYPEALIEDLHVFVDQPGTRFLVLPATEEALPVLRVLNSDFELIKVFRTNVQPGMILYRVDSKEEIK